MSSSKYVCFYVICLYAAIVSANNNETCACYTLGTLSSIDDQSICDNKTLQCKCFKNVIGKNCCKCADGFYNILSGEGCISCRCNSFGSIGKNCNSFTGQCRCKPGFFGSRCNQCQPYSYRFSSERCSKCNCNAYGSKNPQCDILGQCSCLPNVEGKHCDHCKENTFSIQQGCLSCPTCYEFVENASKNYTNYLNTVEERLEQVENDLPLHIQDYQNFLNEVKLLKAKIYKLQLQYEEANSTTSEETVNELTKKINDFHDEVISLLDKFNKDPQYKIIKNALYVGRVNLKEANNLVETCESALANATQISRHLNRHNKTITKIAKDAIVASEEIETKADELTELASNITSSCNQSCNIAELFLINQELFLNELQSINAQIRNTSNGLETMKSYLIGFNQKTNSSKEEALRLQKEANDLDIPVTDDLVLTVNSVEEDLKLIDQIKQDLSTNAKKLDKNKISSEDSLKKIKSKQQDIDDALVLMQSYDKRADLAINDSNNILKLAQESLDKIEEYAKIRQSAEEALKRIPDIRAKIDAVLDHSSEITKIFVEIFGVVKEIEVMQLNLPDIIKLTDNNKVISNTNLELFENLEDQLLQQSIQLTEFDVKLKGMRNNLDNFKKYQNEVDYNITRMEEFIIVLDTVPTTDEQLDEVEAEILKMEEMVWTIEYLIEEKNKLQKEVANVKDIIESLPIEDSSLCESAESEPKQI